MEQLIRVILKIFGRSRLRGYTIRGQKYKPMLRLLKELDRRGIDTKELDALEIFGRDGVDHTTTYADRVRSLEVWEIDGDLHTTLTENLPGASIKIVDSYEEVSNTDKRFDFIVIDNAIGIYKTRCDHFDLFPDLVFGITKDEALLILNVIPHIGPRTIRYFPYLTEQDYLDLRGKFYGTDEPIDVSKDHILDVYKGFVERNRYDLVWSKFIKRNGAGVFYLVLGIKRANPAD